MSAIKKKIGFTTHFDDSISSVKYLAVDCDAAIDAEIIDSLSQSQYDHLRYIVQASAYDVQLKIDHLLHKWGKIKE